MNNLEFAAIDRWLETIGVRTLAEWDVLVFLNRHASIVLPTGDIPKLAGYSSATIVKALNNLEKIGLAKKTALSAGRSFIRRTLPEEPAQGHAFLNLMGAADSRTVRLALRKRLPKDSPPLTSRKSELRIAAFGGSAGGLDALKRILGRLPGDTGVAFVVVQHMAPQQVSLLPELLALATTMPVIQIKDNMPVESNRVFVIPPNANLTLTDHVLRVGPRTLDEHGRHRSIDTFFNSVAGDLTVRSISIILSGMDSDGIIGTAAVKGSGGITIVQLPETAGQPCLPLNVITDRCVDFVRSPEEIADLLVELSQQP